MKQLSIISIRVLAIYLLVSALNAGLPLFTVPSAWGEFKDIPLMVFVGYLVIPLFVGVVLWFLAPKLSSSIPSESGESIPANELIAAGTFLIGIYLFVKYLGMTIGNLSHLFSGVIDIAQINWSYPVVLGLSIFLIIGSKTLVLIFNKVRYAGRNV